MGFTKTASIELTQVECGMCAGVYAISERYRAKKAEAGGFWNCPYCKGSWGYRTEDSELEKARRELTRERARHDQTRADRDRVCDARDRADRRRAAAQGQVTKIKNRVGRGVCPCCNRSFENLARHMKSQHPKFCEEADS